MYTKIFLGLFLSLSVPFTASATPPVIQQVVVPQRVVQYDQTYFTGVNGLYQVGEQIAKEKQTQNLQDDKLDKISSQLEDLINVLKGNAGAVKPGTQPEASSNDKVTAILKKYCASCHSGPSTGFQMFDAKGNLQVDLPHAVRIHYLTEGIGLKKGESMMPKGGKPLSNDEMKAIKEWLGDMAK